jgi:hypothetical protein
LVVRLLPSIAPTRVLQCSHPMPTGVLMGFSPSFRTAATKQPGRSGFDKYTYRRRAMIEQCVGWLKVCRRIGTRFEKLAVNFLAMLKRTIIERHLKLTFQTEPTQAPTADRPQPAGRCRGPASRAAGWERSGEPPRWPGSTGRPRPAPAATAAARPGRPSAE